MEPSPQQQSQQAPPTPDDVPYDTALVSEILKAKRKSRGIKSCFPCRHRKVRCDGGIPCSNCVRRDHASLCRTAVPNSASGTTGMQSTSSQAHRPSAPSIDLLMNPLGCQDVQHTIRGLEKIEEQIATLKAELLGRRHGYDTQSTPAASFYGTATPPNHHEPLTQSTSSKRRWGRRYIEGASGAAIFLGGRADPPATLGCHDDPTPRSTEDALHLDNIMQPEYFAPRTYPFTNLWTTEASLPDVCRTLPHNSDIIRYWQAFETYVFPFYPALVALEEFRSSMFMFLGRRSTAAAPNTSSASPSFVETTDPSWLALLFAVLACGAQFSDDAAKERDLRSKVFICSSFQCLRTANLFHKTDMNQIQAMALVGHSLRNNLETNSAWIFMGTTLRLAQSIGLHEAASMPVPNQLDEAQERRKRQAKHLWWTLVWQDTLLSITYDRPTTSIFTTTAWTVPYSASSPPSNQCPEHKPKGYTFAEAVFHVCQILLDRSRQEHATGPLQSGTPRTAEILEHSKRRLELTVQEAAPYFRDEAYCKTMQEHLERLALQIHVSYAACAIYRLCLDRNNGTSGAGRAKLKEEYIAHAAKAVRSFLDMYRLSPNVCRSWAFVHNAVSCAVTARRFLPVVPQLNPAPPPPPPPPPSLPSFENLISELITVLEREEKQSEWRDADTNVRYFGPYSRALGSLKETYCQAGSGFKGCF
ncbi:fungal-specific transcription factor domain-containing protein [Rhypophila decipiens]|uniref:Fungal-specific transcription factor domain-containing protein n=1 Tax=Rhypophila decipiens TaxID=261697 RepID=A0AAN7B2Y9_9PEZI|nr:fungal-specific transcription factor domain-containing protein [Rhypophila decipiens]